MGIRQNYIHVPCLKSYHPKACSQRVVSQDSSRFCLIKGWNDMEFTAAGTCQKWPFKPDGLSRQGPLCWVHVGVSCISAWVHTHLHNLAYARKWPVITDLEAHLHNLLFFSHISCIYARSRIYGRFSLMQICYVCKILYMRENFPIITDFEAHLNNSRYFLYISCIYTRSRIYGRFSDLLYIQDLAYMQDLAYIADFH